MPALQGKQLLIIQNEMAQVRKLYYLFKKLKFNRSEEGVYPKVHVDNKIPVNQVSLLPDYTGTCT